MQSKKTLSAQEFFEYCTDAANEALRYCFITRATELQKQVVANLTELLEAIAHFKKQAQEAKKENNANRLLSIECCLGAIRSELELWIALKEDRPTEAWGHLINAQQRAADSMRADQDLDLSTLITRLQDVERVVFPRQTFMSTGLIVGRTECTVCRQEYEDCPHVKGRPYMGEFCCEEVREIEEFREVSIVDDPSSKHCRVYRCGRVDVMTLRIVDDEEESEHQPE